MPNESTMPVMPPVVDDGAGGVASGAGSVGQGSDTPAVASDATVTSSNPPAQDSGVPVVASDMTTPGGAPSQDVTGSGDGPYDPLMNSSVVVTPTTVSDEPVAEVVKTDTPTEVIQKIGESHNVLIAISSDPSVDELAAAIGLSIYLDKMGKRATAIYSGKTPNVLEFLKPEETFETSADTLQDFVIALDKEKADHLRYKLDGDYVKIYITPYRHRLSSDDLEFSYGDYNVDLVLALDVANGIDLDEALREHGRIMHDAVIVNITTGNPGKFGEIEWSDKQSSSVSEMIARLLYSIDGEVRIEKEEATAFLTGIVAATNRFSNARTTPNTMRMASRLMESGANQQLVSKNITPDVDNELFMAADNGALVVPADEIEDKDPTKLDIGHGEEEVVDETKEVSDTITEKQSTLLDDLKAAEASLSMAGAEATPDAVNQPVKIENVNEGIGGVSDSALGGAGLDNTQGDASAASVANTSNAGVDVDGVANNVSTEGIDANGGEVAPGNAGKDGSTSGDVAGVGNGASNDNMVAGTVGVETGTTNDSPVVGASGGTEDSGAIGGITAGDGTTGGSGNDSGAESYGVGNGLGEEKTGEAESDVNKVPGSNEGIISTQPEKVIALPNDFSLDSDANEPDKYGKMLEDALESINNAGVGADGMGASSEFGNPAATTMPGNSGAMSPVANDFGVGSPVGGAMGGGSFASGASGNPAVAAAPNVPSNPEINGVPSINYMPMPGDEVLPPPPAPPINMAAPSEPSNVTGNVAGAELSLPNVTNGQGGVGVGQPGAGGAVGSDGATAPQPADPGAFRIPGM